MYTTTNRLPSRILDITYGISELWLSGGTRRCNGVQDVETILIIVYGNGVPLIASAAGLDGAEPSALQPVTVASINMHVL